MNWYWNFIELLKPQEEAPALRFGDLIHRALEKHYPVGIKRYSKPWLIFEKLYKADLRKGQEEFRMWAEDDGWRDALELGIQMMRGYYDLYYEQDLQYRVLSSEQVFQIPLLFTPAERRERGIGTIKVMVVGTMDGVWQDRAGAKRSRETFIKEYKTTGKGLSEIIKGLPLDEQAGTYWTFGPIWLWRKGVLPEGVYPTKILYTIMRKGTPDDRPTDDQGRALNKDGTISKKQPAKLFDRQPIFRDEADRRIMLERVKDEAEVMIKARLGQSKIIKNPGPLFMPNCIGCPFRDPCELHESGHDFDAMLRAMYKKWKPYASHELAERW